MSIPNPGGRQHPLMRYPIAGIVHTSYSQSISIMFAQAWVAEQGPLDSGVGIGIYIVTLLAR